MTRPSVAFVAVLTACLMVFALTDLVRAESVPERIDRGATAHLAAVRGERMQTRPVPPAPTTTQVPWSGPTPGDCDSWRPVFERFGATDREMSFFFGGVLWRETRCGLDTLNEASGDSGVCQINPVHNRSGYFGGRFYGQGGWLAALHGLQTRRDTDSTAWVGACLTLFRVCDVGPWRVGSFWCANNRYP